ncbi:copper transporter [Caldicellulosiruptor naganoensis]|uniref:Copper transporter n=1 Tax=Caldicellulosiruptor naganoensis TaxID=29324 RepID=A0ABY7BE65_9FIRM|nr:copper transporter [Caldicellulosiruptor naganoensis]WAM30652.1 copper transporter [Caldicellulosiruptor naganoensis]
MNGIGVRYFIITIASIFVTLGVGIIIGFSLNSEKFVQKQFQQQLNIIDKNLVALKRENDRLLKEIDEYKNQIVQQGKINNALVNAYLKMGKIDSSVTIVITSTDYSYNDLIDFLRKSGVKINKIIRIKSSFLNIERENSVDYSGYKFPDKAIEGIVIYSVFDIKSNLVTDLIEKRFIEVNILSSGISDTIILAGGNTRQADNFDKLDRKIIESFNNINNLNVIGVQQSYSEVNYCEYYKNMGLSTVDNVDEISGKISLIELIRGNSGNYGTKKEATSIIPSNFLSIEDAKKALEKRKTSLLIEFEKYQNATLISQ